MSNAPRSVTPRAVARLAVTVLVFAAAPTAGDIGSCGQTAEDLDATKFFQAKDEVDCERCTECETGTFVCARACDPTRRACGGGGGGGSGDGDGGSTPCASTEAQAFPPGCYPLVHDGEVCLNALRAASCDDYAKYMADEAPTAPTECNFCPAGGP